MNYPGGWFGKSWGAPVCEDAQRKPIPVGQPCAECYEPVTATDRGLLIPYAVEPPELLAYHLECFVRNVCGEQPAQVLWQDLVAREGSG